MLLAVLETKYLVLAKLTDTVLSFNHSLTIPSSVFNASSTFRYCSLRCMNQPYLTVQKIICSLALAKSIMYIINNSGPNIEP